MKPLLLLILFSFSFLFLSCTSSTRSISELLNEGSVEGCLWFQGNGGPYVSINGVYARGGVPLETCLDARHP